jgi:hypothetical protein
MQAISVSPPSASRFNFGNIGRVDEIAVDWFATRRLCGCSYVVSDESALTGGNWSCKAHGVALGSIQLPFCLIDAKRVGRPIEALEKHFQLATL